MKLLLVCSLEKSVSCCFSPPDFQNYLRTQTGSTTTINVIICTVDYLLRLQVTLILALQSPLFCSLRYSPRPKSWASHHRQKSSLPWVKAWMNWKHELETWPSGSAPVSPQWSSTVKYYWCGLLFLLRATSQLLINETRHLKLFTWGSNTPPGESNPPLFSR